MKFKAVISDEGLRLLQKGFAPTLERFGKTAQVLLGPEDVHLIQDTNNTDGPFVHATLQREALFEGGQVHIGSKYKNLIAFQLDIPNLIRVLHGARNVSASSLEVKLALRELCVDLSTGAMAKKPFLTFTSRDANLDMRYDLPISAPYQSTEVEELVQYKDQTTVCPYYLNLQGPELLRVHGALDKLKVSAALGGRGGGGGLHGEPDRPARSLQNFSDKIELGTTQAGALHVYVSDLSAQVGIELRQLKVMWSDGRERTTGAADEVAGDSPLGRLNRAVRKGQGSGVTVLSKQVGGGRPSLAPTERKALLPGLTRRRTICGDPRSPRCCRCTR